MRFSTRATYGLKAMLELSACYNNGLVSIREISNRRNVPLQYLEQLFKKLRAGQLVESERGAQGGYRLSKQPEDIMVGDVIRVLEGNLAPVECAEADFSCDFSDDCPECKLYRRIHESIEQVIDSTSMADMLADEKSSSGINANRACMNN